MLQDLAVITGGQVVSEDLGLKLENLTEECFGTCAKIKVSAWKGREGKGDYVPSTVCLSSHPCTYIHAIDHLQLALQPLNSFVHVHN